MTGKVWTPSEIEQLRELWGTKTIPQIAKIMERSENAIKIKSTRMGLGRMLDSSEYLNALQIARYMGVDVHAITAYWIPKCGLKAKKIAPLGTRKFTYVLYADLISWLQKNQDKWDSRRMDSYLFAERPEWLRAKEKSDLATPTRKSQLWTPEEDKILIALHRQGVRQADIAKRLNRSISAVEHRVKRLDVWGDGRYISDYEHKQRRELKQRKAAYRQLADLLLLRRNQLAFGFYRQKDLCMRWDDKKGCTANESDCDSCVSFVRIREQYCRRCGATVISRDKIEICKRCVEIRHRQFKRKWAILNARRTNDS